MLPLTGLKFITQLFNAVSSHSYFPKQWKVPEIILIPKPGKSFEEVQRLDRLLPILSKTFEKIKAYSCPKTFDASPPNWLERVPLNKCRLYIIQLEMLLNAKNIAQNIA